MLAHAARVVLVRGRIASGERRGGGVEIGAAAKRVGLKRDAG